MAKPTHELIHIIRRTADKLNGSDDYQWGHMGACNCGFLAQEVTSLSRGEIHRRALQGHGDWNEQLNDYCTTSGLLFDDIITSLLNAGFDIDDLRQLENLNNEEVLNEMPGLHLQRNSRQDAVLYMRVWAELLERRLVESFNFRELAAATTSEFAAV